MKLVLAEKPSVAKSIAKVLGCYNRKDGYCQGSDYIVTWALGHLVELCQPAEYSTQYKRWSLASLPILPEELKVEPIENTIDQYKVVKRLLENEDLESFIIATDAGREGELVARWILKLSNYSGKVQRLWISSQTDEAITQGFNSLKDGDEYLNLYQAAECRAAADWYVGMNVTRALTCHYDAKMSAGRVQTPTLALICKREEEIEAFLGKFYWTLKGDFGSFKASCYPSEDTIRIENEDQMESIKKICKASSYGIVESLEKIKKVEQPPLAYDLTELQRDANLNLGFSAKKTLEVLQRLYEYHKIVTYPRTDSRYITHDIVPTLSSRLKALELTPFAAKARFLANGKMKVDEGRFVNDELVSDHHAIIPTELRVNLEKLSNDEKALWTLIATRFLEVLEQDYEYETTTVVIDVDSVKFKTRLTVPINQGYREIARIVGKRAEITSLDENNENLAKLKINDKVELKGVRSKKMSTDAPSRYNDATLLSAMEHAGRFVDDVDLKKNLQAGLGTPATRADIIEKLINNNYIVRNDNELKPTARGREIVRLAPDLLKSPELTGQWEQRLSLIAKGKENSVDFIKDIKDCARDLVKKVEKTTDSFAPDFKESKTCPWCHSQMMKVVDNLGKVHYLCQQLSCSYEEMEVKKRVLLTPEEIKAKKAELNISDVPKKAVIVKKAVKVVPKKKVLTPKVKVAGSVSSSAAYFSALASKTPSKKIMVKKPSEVKVPTYKYETVIEVVRDSKLNRQRKFNSEKRNDNWNKTKHSYSNESGGSTFADFIKVSEQRHKKRNKK